MHGNFTHENREARLLSATHKETDRWGKAMSDNPHAHGRRESYSGIVPMKRSNESQGGPKEIVAGRPLTKENAEESNPCRTQSRESGSSGLDRVRQAAKEDKKLRFTTLLHHVNIDLLRSSYKGLKKQAAAGADCAFKFLRQWGDVARIWKRPGGTVNGPAWPDSSRSIPGETVTESLDSEIRWKKETTRYRSTGRQSRTVGGSEGSQPDLGIGFSGLLIRVPARAQPARCIGRALCRDNEPKGELHSGLGHKIIFR
jgi:hypothetical protein